jgi:hypothetical protein
MEASAITTRRVKGMERKGKGRFWGVNYCFSTFAKATADRPLSDGASLALSRREGRHGDARKGVRP